MKALAESGGGPADHYRHSRPEYFRALERAHLVERPAESADYGQDQGPAGALSDYPPAMA